MDYKKYTQVHVISKPWALLQPPHKTLELGYRVCFNATGALVKSGTDVWR